jgi:hypothetical protein
VTIPTCICADDGQFYQVEQIWVRDWACLSFDAGTIELLVTTDGGSAKAAVKLQRFPVTLGQLLVGVRTFPDQSGVRRLWRAYEALPTAMAKGFPKRLLPADAKPMAVPRGPFLWRTGRHVHRLERMQVDDSWTQCADGEWLASHVEQFSEQV